MGRGAVMRLRVLRGRSWYAWWRRVSAGTPAFVTSAFLRDCLLRGGHWGAVVVRGMRGYGISLDDDVCGRRFLPGDVLLVPLLPPTVDLHVKTFPCGLAMTAPLAL
jgi:hypothetical protein